MKSLQENLSSVCVHLFFSWGLLHHHERLASVLSAVSLMISLSTTLNNGGPCIFTLSREIRLEETIENLTLMGSQKVSVFCCPRFFSKSELKLNQDSRLLSVSVWSETFFFCLQVVFVPNSLCLRGREQMYVDVFWMPLDSAVKNYLRMIHWSKYSTCNTTLIFTYHVHEWGCTQSTAAV